MTSIERRLERIEHGQIHIHNMLRTILRGEMYLARDLNDIMTDLTEITARVTETRDAEDAAVLLLGDLKARLDSAGVDPVALKALSDQLGSGKEALAAAIVANTPSGTNPNFPNPGQNPPFPVDPNNPINPVDPVLTPRPDPNNPANNTGTVTIRYDGPLPGVDVGGQHFDAGVPVTTSDANVILAVRREGNFTIS